MAVMVETRTIRPMHDEEIEEVRGVLARANEQFRGLVPDALFDAYLADVLDIESRLDRSTTLVATDRGRIVGTVTYFRDANDEAVGPSVPAGTAGVRAVAVDPAARGAGLGRRLAAEVVEQARADGARAVVLHTWFVMRAAIRVYESLGFRRAPAYDADSTDFFPTSIDDDPAALAFWLDL
jgi:GNAT superfamily N-acetyltransferase